jgi:hypothetical protein
MEDAPINAAAPTDPHPALTEIEKLGEETLGFLGRNMPLFIQVGEDIAAVAGGGIGAIVPVLLKNLPALAKAR